MFSREVTVWVMSLAVMALGLGAEGRTFEFKSLGTKGTSVGNKAWWGDTEKTKSGAFRIKVGSATKFDDMSTMEIRAATVFRSVTTKQTAVNDIATLSFDPINTTRAIYFMVATGTAFSRTDNYYVDGRYDRGWQMAGCVIEMWQGGKVVKHWSNIAGKGGAIKLTEDTKQLKINEKGYESSSYGEFNNATEIIAINNKGEKISVEELLAEFRDTKGKEAKGDAGKSAERDSDEDSEADSVDPYDFKLKSFCGYEFGALKTGFSPTTYVKMPRPFRHYDSIRPTYGTYSEKLISVYLKSLKPIPKGDEFNEVLGAVAVIEKKYGIKLERQGPTSNYFYFSNPHVSIRVSPSYIEVTNRDVEKGERKTTRRLIEQEKPDDGKDAEVL